jgi:hypothetical protein
MADEFMETLRVLCDEYGSLLIFDEVMSGFRVAYKGAQSLFNVKPDLITYAKIIGGGLPCGVYGGRREILNSCRQIAEKVKAGEIDPSDITEQMLSDNMYLPDVPDPELIIRPSGEMRLSNFLLWESAYSEFWVSDTLWPDFGYEDLTQAFRDFASRDRRFGGLSKKESKT